MVVFVIHQNWMTMNCCPLRDAELIEIRAYDKVGDEVLLATHLIARGGEEEETREQNASIILERGQELFYVSHLDEVADQWLRGQSVKKTSREINADDTDQKQKLNSLSNLIRAIGIILWLISARPAI